MSVTVILSAARTRDLTSLSYRRRRRGRGASCMYDVPPKIREKYFAGNYYGKFGHFSGKNHVYFSGILLIFPANIIKIRVF